MRKVGWDSWAWIEHELRGPRDDALRELSREVDVAFTVRDVVVETFNHLVQRAKSGEAAWAWWQDVRASGIHVLEPTLAEIEEYVARRRRPGRLSLTDYALAWACEQEGTGEVATEDHEFRKLGLTPLFAKR